ncbi:MAG TPA: alpha/beta fold hydrolase [Pseudonocardiaceae bacterium]|nr:alpha/beta fold hydrolase [Pseudonocardiaceae bacterium]
MADRWFQPFQRSDFDSPLRLFLFHYAGAGAAVYHEWSGLLPPDVAGVCVQLPGRQDRRSEPPTTELAVLVEVLTEVFAAELDDRPYALFGHSMGALLAYRMAVALSDDPPALIGVSGWAPEGFTMPTATDVALRDDGIVARMAELGALPPQAAANPDVLALAVPAMRADMAVCASYVDDHAMVDCPIVAYSGAADPLLAPAAMNTWSGRTAEYLGNRVFPGGHFFVDDQALGVVADLIPLLRRHAAAARQAL